MKFCGSSFPLVVAIALLCYDDWYLQFSEEKGYWRVLYEKNYFLFL